jgi:hypothetical protein
LTFQPKGQTKVKLSHSKHSADGSRRLAGGDPGGPLLRRQLDRALRSHKEAARLLRRLGYSDEFISEVLSQLPDPIDPERDEPVLARYGLNPERLMDRMGGSP